jgi:hypothetical protein
MGTEEIEDTVLLLNITKTVRNFHQNLHLEQRDQRDNYLEQNQSPSSYNKLDRPRYRSMTPPHGNQATDDK